MEEERKKKRKKERTKERRRRKQIIMFILSFLLQTFAVIDFCFFVPRLVIVVGVMRGDSETTKLLFRAG